VANGTAKYAKYANIGQSRFSTNRIQFLRGPRGSRHARLPFYPLTTNGPGRTRMTRTGATPPLNSASLAGWLPSIRVHRRSSVVYDFLVQAPVAGFRFIRRNYQPAIRQAKKIPNQISVAGI
jgi:hypothetical protein